MAVAAASPGQPAACPEPGGTEAGVSALPLAERLTSLLNQQRQRHGLLPMQRDPALDNIAREHSQWMASRKQLSHEGFQRRFDLAQGQLCVENLGVGNRARPERYVSAWLASPSHRSNLLEPRTRLVGVAEVGGFVTVFACEMPEHHAPLLPR